MVQRRLRGSVAAPAGVRLDGGVGADVDDDRAARQVRERLLDERKRGEQVDLEDAAQLLERIRGERGLRARPERAGVVDDEVDPVAGRRDERALGDAGRRRRPRGDDAVEAWVDWPVPRSSRASTTSVQPRAASAQVSASPSPRDTPVMMPMLMRPSSSSVHLKSRAGYDRAVRRVTRRGNRMSRATARAAMCCSSGVCRTTPRGGHPPGHHRAARPRRAGPRRRDRRTHQLGRDAAAGRVPEDPGARGDDGAADGGARQAEKGRRRTAGRGPAGHLELAREGGETIRFDDLAYGGYAITPTRCSNGCATRASCPGRALQMSLPAPHSAMDGFLEDN